MAQDEPESWKDKYLLSIEKFEHAQQQAEQRLDILRRGVVRMSLAADGLDEPLDEVLAELRSSIRKSEDVLELEPMISRLEKCVVALDDNRKEDYSSVTEMIDASLAAVLETGMPRKDKSAVKTFRKGLPSMLQGAMINVDLWKQYIEVQQPVYKYLAELEQGTKKSGGLFQKLFSSTASNENGNENRETEQKRDAAEESENGIVDQAVEEPVVADDVELGKVDVDQAVAGEIIAEDESIESVGEAAGDQDSSVEGQEQVREEIKSRTIQVFCGLVDQIETPDEFDGRKTDLVARLQNDFEWQCLPDLLSEAMELVASTRKVAQLEFEGFLVTIHDRLQDIQDFLTIAREGEEQAQLNQTKLDEEVRTGLKEIKASVDEALDIGVLKEDITTMVNQIVAVIDTFHSDEKDRRYEVYDRIEVLGAKMEEMEAEAVHLRNNLEAQRLQAMRDPLTELPNRQAYDEQSEKEFSRWKRHQRPLSMAIVDIDHFKKINDNLGHLRGDKVLKLVAKEVQKNIRSEDFVARYGGEEFVVLMPDTNEPEALAAVEKVRAAIECCPFNFAGERVKITASFGVSVLVSDDTMVSCFDRVDKALYRAKEAGRNRVEKG